MYYHEKRYLKGIKVANKVIKLTKKIDTKDLYAEALLIRAKNEIKRNVLSKREVAKIMKEAVAIAEEINCPEVLWKVYFEYGNILQNYNEYQKALDYYEKCIDVLMDVNSKIKNESFKKSYLNRPDRQAVFMAIDII